MNNKDMSKVFHIHIFFKSFTVFIFCIILIIVSYPSVFADEKLSAVQLTKNGYIALRKGDFDTAKSFFEQAISKNSKMSMSHIGLGIVLFRKHNEDEAEKEFIFAQKFDSHNPLIYQMLGEVAYRRNNFENTIKLWKKALKLSPSDKILQNKLKRVQIEMKTEKNFAAMRGSYFVIKYKGYENKEMGRIVLELLNNAYRDIGHYLSSLPLYGVNVILYSGKQFHEVTKAPDWSGALYDGKIRIPIMGYKGENDILKHVLYHEYTHVVVHSITISCPTWLNEGLAQHFEPKEITEKNQNWLIQLKSMKLLPSLKDLEIPFGVLNAKQAELAYLCSLSAVDFIIKQYGLNTIVELLQLFGRGETSEEAIMNEYGFSYKELTQKWQEALQDEN